MPEGDTIFRTARTLNSALAGKTVTRFETGLAHLARVDDEQAIAGRVVESVRSVGKHLLIDFSGDLHLRTHMRMNGSWHIYRAGERWQRSRNAARIVIETEEWVAVAFDVNVSEFLSGDAIRRQRDLRALGPDLLAEDFDTDAALQRLRECGTSEIADALLNQRVMAGVGNIWKSEALFVAQVNPFVLVKDLDDATLTKIIGAARKLLQRSAAGQVPRAVYERQGKPCVRCGTAISYRKQGEDVRGTCWCPKCQR